MNEPAALISPRYRLLDQLGAGGMGTVYRAFDRLTGHTVALKRVNVAPEQLQFASRSNAAGDALLLALAQEFKLLASLRHPHIISVLDYGFDVQRQPYFTMELLDQPQTLLEAAQDQPLDFKINLLIQTLQALAYLHRRGIIHHDLKPENVLVSGGQVRVLDFGLAVMHDQNHEDDTFGTILYLPPEIYEGGVYSPAGDMYAVGVMAYEMLVGQHPFYTEDATFFIDQVLTAEPDFSSLESYPGLAAVIAKLLARQPEQRYQESHLVIADLCTAIGQPTPEESVAIRESFLQAATFVGREAELAQLTEALEKAVSGQGSVWLVGGESGVGKSRLLDELRTQALVAGASVLRGQAVEEGGLPYQLWRDPLRQLILSVELSDLEAGVLKTIVPDIERILDRAIPDAPKLEGRPGQQRLNLTVMELFRRQTQPVLLILEDLQWTSESLGPLKELSQLVAELSLLIVGSYRNDERPGLPNELPVATTIQLARLSAQDVAELCASMLGGVGAHPHLVDLIQRETEGNAFFMVEVVRTLAEEAGRLHQIDATTLPTTVFAGGIQQIVQRRLRRVPEEAWPLLKQAAVMGRQLDLTLLRHVTETNLDSWLNLCAEVAVLEVQENSWRFTHDKLRETLIGDLQVEDRRVLHEQAAVAIEAVYSGDKSYTNVLLEHWHMAGNKAKEADYAFLATEGAVNIAAYRDALKLGQRALALCRQYNNQNKEVVILRRLGDAYTGLGEYSQAAEYFQQSLTLAQTLSDQFEMAWALRRLGTVAYMQSDFETAATYYTQSLDLTRLIDDQAGTASSLNNLGNVAWSQGNLTDAKVYLEESLKLYTDLGGHEDVPAVLNNLGNVAWSEGDLEATRRYTEESLALWRKSLNRDGMAIGLTNLGELIEHLGDLVAAQQLYQECLALRRVIGDRWGIAFTLASLASSYLKQQNLSEARHCLLQGLQVANEVGAVLPKLHNLLYYARLLALEYKPQAGGELLGLIMQHPGSDANIIDNCRREVYPLLEAALDADIFEEILSRGAGFDLDTTIASILVQVQPSS